MSTSTLYRAIKGRIACGGFEAVEGYVVRTAPILRKAILGLPETAAVNKLRMTGWEVGKVKEMTHDVKPQPENHLP